MRLFAKYISKALKAESAGDTETALRAVDSALFIRPDSAEATALKGRVLIHDEASSEGALHLELALRAGLRRRTDLLLLVDVLLNRLEQPEKALRLIDAKAPILGWDNGVHRLRAEALIELGRFDEAVSHLREAITSHTDDADLHFLMGWLLRRAGDLFGAGASLKRAAALDPMDADAHYQLGWVYEGLGEYHSMRREFERTFELDRLRPPKLRFDGQEFEDMVTEALLDTEDPTEGNHIAMIALDYPERRMLEDFPHDPRAMCMLLEPGLVLEEEEDSLFDFPIMVFFQWNVERLRFSRGEAVMELRRTAEQELAVQEGHSGW